MQGYVTTTTGFRNLKPKPLKASELIEMHRFKDEESKHPQTEGQDNLQSAQLTKKTKSVTYCKPGVKIGKGKFGPIELIIYNQSLCALKRIPKASIDKGKRIEHLKNEKKVLIMLKEISRQEKADFFIDLLETFADQDSINYVTEYCPGQDLFWVIQNEMNLKIGKQKNKNEWVKFYAAEVLVALEVMHKHKLIYRDLKPENVVIDKDGHIKMIDFGFAKRLSSMQKHRTFTNCGTLGYTAPEMLLPTAEGYSF